MKKLLLALSCLSFLSSLASAESKINSFVLTDQLQDFHRSYTEANKTPYSLTTFVCESLCTFKSPDHGVISSPASRELIANYEYLKVRKQFTSPKEIYEELVNSCKQVVESKIMYTGTGYQFDGYPRSIDFINLITKPEIYKKKMNEACRPLDLSELTKDELIGEINFLRLNL